MKTEKNKSMHEPDVNKAAVRPKHRCVSLPVFGYMLATSLAAMSSGCALIEAPSRARIEYWEKHIDALCAKEFEKDKAYKVYEQDVLPVNEHYFYSDGRSIQVLPNNWEKSGYKNPPGVDFVFDLVEVKVLNESNPRVSLYATRAIRLRDKKVLAESYSYIRAGGEIWALGYLNRHSCPGDGSHVTVLKATFKNFSETSK